MVVWSTVEILPILEVFNRDPRLLGAARENDRAPQELGPETMHREHALLRAVPWRFLFAGRRRSRGCAPRSRAECGKSESEQASVLLRLEPDSFGGAASLVRSIRRMKKQSREGWRSDGKVVGVEQALD